MILRHFIIAMAVLLIAVLGLTGYAWHMRKTAASTPVASTDTRPLAPPVAGPTERPYLSPTMTRAACAPSRPRFLCPPAASSALKNCCAPCSPSISINRRTTLWAPVPTSAASF